MPKAICSTSGAGAQNTGALGRFLEHLGSRLVFDLHEPRCQLRQGLPFFSAAHPLGDFPGLVRLLAERHCDVDGDVVAVFQVTRIGQRGTVSPEGLFRCLIYVKGGLERDAILHLRDAPCIRARATVLAARL